MAVPNVKCVVVGSHGVGKTSLLMTYQNKSFATNIPAVLEGYVPDVTVDGKQAKIALWDTAGQEEWDRLRPLSYPKTDVFILAFSVVEPNTFTRAKSQWFDEVRHHCGQSVPIILLGTKTDLRNHEETVNKLTQSGSAPVTAEQGQHLATQFNAIKYFECSAVQQEGLDAVINEAVRAGAGFPPYQKAPPPGAGGRRSGCVLL